MHKRGHPKGHEMTVVGLPLKKKSAHPKLVPFLKLHTSTKEKGKINACTYKKHKFSLLSLLLYSNVAMVCESFATAPLNITRQLIEEEKVEVCADKLQDAVVDENIDVHLIRKYFTKAFGYECCPTEATESCICLQVLFSRLT